MTEYWAQMSSGSWIQIPTIRDVAVLFNLGYLIRLGQS